MRRFLRATETSDAEALVERAVRALPPGALDDVQSGALARQTNAVLRSLIEQGQKLAASGSQMRAERKIQVGSVEFVINFTVGVRPTFWERLRSTVRGS